MLVWFLVKFSGSCLVPTFQVFKSSLWIKLTTLLNAFCAKELFSFEHYSVWQKPFPHPIFVLFFTRESFCWCNKQKSIQVCVVNLKPWAKVVCKNYEKKILGTSDAWSTSRLSHQRTSVLYCRLSDSCFKQCSRLRFKIDFVLPSCCWANFLHHRALSTYF